METKKEDKEKQRKWIPGVYHVGKTMSMNRKTVWRLFECGSLNFLHFCLSSVGLEL